MTRVENEKLVIVIEDPAPAERRTWLIKAIARHLAHYAANPHKRKEDMEYALVLADLLMEITEE